MSQAHNYTVADALAIVFGTPPFGTEYTTAHVTTVICKLLGTPYDEEPVLAALRAAAFATPRPGTTRRHPLKWRFSRAELPGRPAAPRRPRQAPRREKSFADSQKLKL